MKFKITLLIVLTVLVSNMGWGQVTIFSENIGSPTATTAIASNTFQNSTGTLTYSGTADVRNSTVSSGYTGASGGGNIFITNTIAKDFQIATISTVGYNTLTLSFGAFKSTTASTMSELILEYSVDGVSYSALTIPYQPTGTGTAVWRLISSISLPVAANNVSNLRLRWRQTSATPQFRLDDIKLQGLASSTYSLTYNGNGNTSGTAPVDPTSPYASGATVTTLGNTGSLAKTGSTFAGWNTAANGSGTAQAASSTFSMPAANTTLYAQWTNNNYTVTFDANTGAGSMTNQTIAYGASANLTSNSFTKTGYSFAGWNTLANGTGTSYTNAQSYTMGAANATLYAQWTTNSYTVSFDANTGAGSMTNQTIAYGASANLTSNSFTKTGYSFAGWNTLANGTGTSYTNAQSYTMGAANATLYAQWTANNNTLTFDGNSATSGSTAAQTIATNASANLTSNGFVKTGYNFTGWSTTAGGSFTYADGASYTMGTSNATLYAVWTVASLPTISYSGSLTSVNTTYGTASASPATFSVSGSSLTDNITLSAPAGYELSSGSGYSTTLILSQSGGVVSSTPINVRLAATTAVGTYSGTIVLTSTGATSVNVSTVNSTVSPVVLTISGLTGANKEYDGTIAATFTGTASYVGLVNGETFSVSGTPSATFISTGVGTSKPITLTGYTVPSLNYTLTQPILSADITAKALTVSGASAANKPYDGTTTASITGGNLVGVISPDVVTLIQAGIFVSSNVGIGISVTSNFSISGADAGNYTLTQPSGLSADITQVAQTITFSALANQTVGVADYNPGATASSGLIVTYTSSNPAVATIVGGLIHVVGVGTTTITASQAGNGTYLAASDVNQNLTVVYLPLAAWEVSGLAGGLNNFGPNPLDTISANANVLITKLNRGGGITTSGTGAASAWGGTGVNSTSFANAISGNDFITFGVKAKPGYTVSFSEIPAYNIRRSSSGATTGQWQYQLNSGSFVDIGSSITWGTTTTAAGNLQSGINLSAITALQEVPSSVNVTFRLVIWGGTAAGGTWYINNISGNDLQVTGSVNEYVSPLPVEFLDFSATCNEINATDLKWSTASEHNSDYFKIEKSSDGINWSMLAKVAAAGNATERIDYALVDNEKTRGLYYKLWQYDVDGTANLLATIQENCFESNRSLEPIIYPNPITDQEVTIELRNDKAEFISVQIYSMQGTLVFSQQMKATEQITLSKLNVDPGVYQLILQLDADNVSSFKICVK